MTHEGSNGNTLQSNDPPEVYDDALPEVVQAPKTTDESRPVAEQVGKDHIIPEIVEENVTPRGRISTLVRVRRRTFYVIVAVVLIVIAAALGGGIGGALGSRNMSESNSDADGTTISTFSTDSSSSSTTTTSNTASTSTSTSTAPCTEGTVAAGETQNYLGLCKFCCAYGYCPLGPCTCTGHGNVTSLPPETGVEGCPLPGESEGYRGLCSFACNHGYCPPGACTTNC